MTRRRVIGRTHRLWLRLRYRVEAAIERNERRERQVFGWCAHRHWPYLRFSAADHHAVGDPCCVAERCEVYGTQAMELP